MNVWVATCEYLRAKRAQVPNLAKLSFWWILKDEYLLRSQMQYFSFRRSRAFSDGRTDGQTDGRTDGQMDVRTLPSTLSPSLRG